MLDVHPPHHAANTWRDFFIHIATIVVGLLIAVGLEQTVEYIHHRHQAREAHESISAELDANREALKIDKQFLAAMRANLSQNLGVLHRLRSKTLRSDDRIAIQRTSFRLLSTSAWTTARDSGAMALLPSSEQRAFGDVYSFQEYFNRLMQDNLPTLRRAASVLYEENSSDFFHVTVDAKALQQLTPAQLDRLEQAIQEGIAYQDTVEAWIVSIDLRLEPNAISH